MGIEKHDHDGAGSVQPMFTSIPIQEKGLLGFKDYSTCGFCGAIRGIMIDTLKATDYKIEPNAKQEKKTREFTIEEKALSDFLGFPISVVGSHKQAVRAVASTHLMRESVGWFAFCNGTYKVL